MFDIQNPSIGTHLLYFGHQYFSVTDIFSMYKLFFIFKILLVCVCNIIITESRPSKTVVDQSLEFHLDYQSYEMLGCISSHTSNQDYQPDFDK